MWKLIRVPNGQPQRYSRPDTWISYTLIQGSSTSFSQRILRDNSGRNPLKISPVHRGAFTHGLILQCSSQSFLDRRCFSVALKELWRHLRNPFLEHKQEASLQHLWDVPSTRLDVFFSISIIVTIPSSKHD